MRETDNDTAPAGTSADDSFARPAPATARRTGLVRLALLFPALFLFPAACRNGDERKQPDPSGTSAAAAHPATTGPTTGPAVAGPAAAAGEQSEKDDTRLHGSWVADNVPTDVGQVKIRLSFSRKGNLQLLAWSELPFVGQVRNKEGPYEVRGGTIHSEAIRGGTSVKYWFTGGDLVIQYGDGKTVRFHRAK